MKRVIILIAVLALMCGTAFAAPVLILNGTVDLHATAVSDGTETDLTLRTFQLLGQNADGSYLIHFNKKLFNVAAADMTRAIVFDAEVPALGALETLSRGSKGDEVKPIQEALKAQGFLTGSADGDFGPGTERAITAFQEANGLEATGQADEITQRLLLSLGEETLQMSGVVDPTVMFAPILGRTQADLTPIMDSGMVFTYDDISGEGFISCGAVLKDSSVGGSDLDKYALTCEFGIITRESENGVLLMPAMKLRCECVRQSVPTDIVLKAGNLRASGEVEDLQVALNGLDTVESGVVMLDDAMVDVLANAADAGELKLRVNGRYRSFDLKASDANAVAVVGSAAKAVRKGN